MEHITEVTNRALAAGAAEQLSLRINESQAATRRGLENAIPVSVAGLATFAANGDNARELFRTLRRGSYPHLGPEEVVEPAVSDEMARSSSGFLLHVFGGRLDDIVESLAAQSSVSRPSARMLLGLATPLVLEAVAREMQSRHLDAGGLSRFLADEGREASAALPSPLSTMVGGGMLVGAARPLVPEEVRVREVDVESPARVRRLPVAGERTDWWRPLLWVVAALIAVGIILFLVSRARRTEAPSIETTAPETTVPERAIPLIPPVTELAPRDQLVRPPVAGPETPPSVTPPEAPAAPAGPETPPSVTPPEAPAAPAPSRASELSTYLEGTEATPRSFPLNGVEFALGSATVSDPAMLDDVAKALADHPDAKIRLEGRTDATGGQARNKALSRERAEAVKKQLVAQGVAPDRIDTMGMASSKPAGSKAMAEANAQERRVDLVVIKR